MSTETPELEQAQSPDQPPAVDSASKEAGSTAASSATTKETAPKRPIEPPPPPDSNHPTPGSGGGPPAEQLILQRDLNEVLLLLDFISGRPDVHIWDIGDIKYPVLANIQGQQPAPLQPIEVIRRICALQYPPEASQSLPERADNSALLLCVKDKLNSIAYPASGLTIAYTYMFIEETAQLRRDHPTGQHTSPVFVEKGTRGTLAKTAYPGLVANAKRFRCFHRNVARVGAVITLFSALLLWLVVYGAQLTSRFEEDQKSAVDVTGQIYALVDKENAAIPADKQTHDSVPTRCESRIDNQSNQIKLLCNQWSYYQARYEKSINDVAAFADRWPSLWLTAPFPTSPILQKNKTGEYVATQDNIQSITLVLAAYSSYVLPVLFGLVGTIASFLRDISNRITGSILSPHDETLAIIRLILGAIAGLAVGLFFTPATLAAQISSGAGVLTLSASGIAFLAGYGADGFFRMIDALITRIFSLDQKPPPKKG
jgi:hypothetical protein